MKKKLLLILFFLNFSAYAQNKTILVFDLLNKTQDSIKKIIFDTTILSDKTEHSLGIFNNNVEILEQQDPVVNVYPNSNFTYKKQAYLDYDLTNYPIRTSLKLFNIENDSLKSLCSASLVSRKHVLTAAHCVSSFNTNMNKLSIDSLQVSPVFDNGNFNASFSSSLVSKVYFFKDWSLNYNDLAILELIEPIGEKNGWLSIGFNDNEAELTEGIFYKFSYPANTFLMIDSNHYNGDTLYYNYGKVDYTNNSQIGIYNTSGIPGESGSSIIKVVNYQDYISYGVLTWSNNLKHSRIANWIFYAFKNIIKDDLILNINKRSLNNKFSIYPNPVNNYFHIKNDKEINEIKIFDILGKEIISINNHQSNSKIDVSKISRGIYYVKFKIENSIKTFNFLKK